jgi:mannose-6-phosphate isomerase-like protein (cupin superfamily)
MPKRKVPIVINMNSVPSIPPENSPLKQIRLRRLITKSAHGSNLLLGVGFMDPGEKTNVWSTKDEDDTGPNEPYYGPVDETYFIFRGNLVLTWDEGELEIGPGDAVYLAAGYRYQLKNVGTEPVFFVYNLELSRAAVELA